ncbi:hypothetical protein AAFF_G00037290 [Aldrovandia affinis]|uniref:Uncharacterized protein n=1 Tax=Aldrovandia affinis TaxID=143900 RepID=A0AAD7T4X9_9TELE|nr:hypothetical protein AAFF_G00037290 [Aldrovandia affinis]
MPLHKLCTNTLQSSSDPSARLSTETTPPPQNWPTAALPIPRALARSLARPSPSHTQDGTKFRSNYGTDPPAGKGEPGSEDAHEDSLGDNMEDG